MPIAQRLVESGDGSRLRRLVQVRRRRRDVALAVAAVPDVPAVAAVAAVAAAADQRGGRGWPSRYSADSGEKELGEWLKGQRRRHRLKSLEDSVRIGSVSRTKREWMSELDACWTTVQKEA